MITLHLHLPRYEVWRYLRWVFYRNFCLKIAKWDFIFPLVLSCRVYANISTQVNGCGEIEIGTLTHILSLYSTVKLFVILKAADGSTEGIDHTDYAISNAGIGTDKCSTNAEHRSTCYQLGCDKPLRPLYVGINSTNDNASTAGPMILFSKLIDYDREIQCWSYINI